MKTKSMLWMALLMASTMWAQIAKAPSSWSSATEAVVPRLVRFAGTTKDDAGKPLTGIAGLTFSLYKDQEGGGALWMETQNVQLDSNGRYSVMLGASKAEGLPAELFATGEARWLGVQAAGQAEQPRVLLLSVPYALKAADAETLGGKPASAFLQVLPSSEQTNATPNASAGGGPAGTGGGPAGSGPQASPTVHGSGTVNYLPIWTGSTLIGNSTLFEKSGSLGIGTTSPATTLDVNGPATIRGNTSVIGSISAISGFNLGSNVFAFGSYSSANSFFGFSGNSTMAGTGNTAAGEYALHSNSSGANNVANGVQSLYANTSGSNNTADGRQALNQNTTGSNNTATGYAAADFNSTGHDNTVSGYESLYFNTTGSYNTATGSQTLYNNGAGSTNTATGFDALNANTSGGFNTASGGYALFSNLQGSNNTASGVSALFTNTTGGNNTATGMAALGSNTTGSDNTADGYEALFFNTAGNNTANGYQALYSNTTGPGNTASGYQALFSNNVGGGNTATGITALASNTTGNNNTAVGEGALFLNTTGSNNTALGYLAGTFTSTGLANATAIGAYSSVQASNSLVLGSIKGVNFAPASTNVGIGTTIPQAALDVAGNGLEVYAGDPQCGGSGTAAIGFGNSGFVNCGNYAMRGDGGGNLYVNSSGTGWMFFDHNNTGLMSLDPSGNLSVAGSINAGTKNFKIDHPLDPANKYLYHASVESSEMMNIYTGNVTTNASGDATVELPDWFEALNADFRYQLTVIGQFAQAIVASEIANRHFAIKTDKPNVKVSWQVTGVRHDAWAAAHSLQVEVEKTGQERGHYLHPELYPAAQ